MLDSHVIPIVSTLALLGTTLGCVETRGSAWMKQPLVAPGEGASMNRQTSDADGQRSSGPTKHVTSITLGQNARRADRGETQRGHGSEARRVTLGPVQGTPAGVFRNTYYSFPDERDYDGPRTPLYDGSCHKIATVPQSFHDTLCVQGSGHLTSHRTVSFARRDCACARTCPRTGQKICYEPLPPSRFPWGRGATGKPIHPFRTVAADTNVLPMGSVLYIPAFTGKPIPNQAGRHDGCFRVEDRGKAIQGTSVDIFVGSNSSLKQWNSLVPTGVGVAVFLHHRACAYLAK